MADRGGKAWQGLARSRGEGATMAPILNGKQKGKPQPCSPHFPISTAHSGKTPQVAGPGTRLNHLHSTLICGSRKDKESRSGNGPANGYGSLFLGLLIKMQQKHPY